MKILLLLLLPIAVVATTYQDPPVSSSEGSPLEVVSQKWSTTRRVFEKNAADSVSPAQAMIPQNKNFSRNARINDPAGVRDPNQDTLDGRSAAIDKNVKDSKTSQPKATDGFAYKIKVQNTGKKAVEIVFWEYQFADPANLDQTARRQFLCGVNIGQQKTKELEGFSLSGPSDVINVSTLSNGNAFKEKVVINRVEYSDGTIWQRKDWHLSEVQRSYERVLREPWVPGTCKGL
jgi:hypothetical protein